MHPKGLKPFFKK
jgi:hypothetical protein